MCSISSLHHKLLNGIFSVYKPTGKSMNQVFQAIRLNLIKELNRLPSRPLRKKLQMISKDNCNDDLPLVTSVPDLADHTLVVGLRYMENDIQLGCVDALNWFSSGVTIVGIEKGVTLIRPLSKSQHMKVYHVTGQLGVATSNFRVDGKIIERSTYHHVTQARVDRVVAGMQAGHQKHMYIASGVDMESEEAYELACQGLLRPYNSQVGPVLYGIRCIHFLPPYFTLEVHSINESCDYMCQLIHNIGVELRTNACCSKLRRIRHGLFTLNNSLLLKHACNPAILVEHISQMRNLVSSQQISYKPTIGYLKDDPNYVYSLKQSKKDAYLSDDKMYNNLDVDLIITGDCANAT